MRHVVFIIALAGCAQEVAPGSVLSGGVGDARAVEPAHDLLRSGAGRYTGELLETTCDAALAGPALQGSGTLWLDGDRLSLELGAWPTMSGTLAGGQARVSGSQVFWAMGAETVCTLVGAVTPVAGGIEADLTEIVESPGMSCRSHALLRFHVVE